MGTRADAAGWCGLPRTSATQMLGYSSALLSFSSPGFKVTLKNVNGRERDTSVRKSTAWYPHPSTRSSSALALEVFGGWGNGLGANHPTLSGPERGDGLTHAKHAVPSKGHIVRPVFITLR